jgi:hypothetical protein
VGFVVFSLLKNLENFVLSLLVVKRGLKNDGRVVVV